MRRARSWSSSLLLQKRKLLTPTAASLTFVLEIATSHLQTKRWVHVVLSNRTTYNTTPKASSNHHPVCGMQTLTHLQNNTRKENFVRSSNFHQRATIQPLTNILHLRPLLSTNSLLSSAPDHFSDKYFVRQELKTMALSWESVAVLVSVVFTLEEIRLIVGFANSPMVLGLRPPISAYVEFPAWVYILIDLVVWVVTLIITGMIMVFRFYNLAFIICLTVQYLVHTLPLFTSSSASASVSPNSIQTNNSGFETLEYLHQKYVKTYVSKRCKLEYSMEQFAGCLVSLWLAYHAMPRNLPEDVWDEYVLSQLFFNYTATNAEKWNTSEKNSHLQIPFGSQL